MWYSWEQARPYAKDCSSKARAKPKSESRKESGKQEQRYPDADHVAWSEEAPQETKRKAKAATEQTCQVVEMPRDTHETAKPLQNASFDPSHLEQHTSFFGSIRRFGPCQLVIVGLGMMDARPKWADIFDDDETDTSLWVAANPSTAGQASSPSEVDTSAEAQDGQTEQVHVQGEDPSSRVEPVSQWLSSGSAPPAAPAAPGQASSSRSGGVHAATEAWADVHDECDPLAASSNENPHGTSQALPQHALQGSTSLASLGEGATAAQHPLSVVVGLDDEGLLWVHDLGRLGLPSRADEKRFALKPLGFFELYNFCCRGIFK
eukprot:s2266_g2.t1